MISLNKDIRITLNVEKEFTGTPKCAELFAAYSKTVVSKVYIIEVSNV